MRYDSRKSSLEVRVFQAARCELARLEHSHGNNDWHQMAEVTSDHDAAGSDPERPGRAAASTAARPARTRSAL